MSIQSKKTILITGCSPGGIGYALACKFHSRGLHVFATARNEKALADLTALEGIEALPLEVTSPESISELKKRIVERTGGSLDYLVNNAGRNYTVPALDLDFTEVEDCFDINVISVMRMCQAFAPLLIQASGTIINIGSAAADLPYVFGSVYNASKAAMHSYTDTLRVELAPFDVKVMLVVATGVKTNVLRVHRDLPADSVFFPLNAEYRQRQLQPREKGMSATDFAAELVEAALKPNPAASRWIGPQATMVWFLLGLFPNIYWQYHFSKLVNMDKLARIVKDQKKWRYWVRFSYVHQLLAYSDFISGFVRHDQIGCGTVEEVLLQNDTGIEMLCASSARKGWVGDESPKDNVGVLAVGAEVPLKRTRA